jgi:DNA repair exonuclease SbcCD ATPase subunit
MGCFKKFKFWKRRNLGADLYERIEELAKRLEERDKNQEQSETAFRGRIAELEKQLEDRKEVGAKLRDRIRELEKIVGERDRERKGTDTEAIKKNQQGSYTNSDNVEDGLNVMIKRPQKQLQELDGARRELEATHHCQCEELQTTIRKKEEVEAGLHVRIKEYGKKLRQEECNNKIMAASYRHLIKELNLSLRTAIREKKEVEDALRNPNNGLVAARIKDLENIVRKEQSNRRTMAAIYHSLIEGLDLSLKTAAREKQEVEEVLQDRIKELVKQIEDTNKDKKEMEDALCRRIEEYKNEIQKEVSNRESVFAIYRNLVLELNSRLETTARELKEVKSALGGRIEEHDKNLHCTNCDKKETNNWSPTSVDGVGGDGSGGGGLLYKIWTVSWIDYFDYL